MTLIKSDLELLERAAEEAGELAMRFFRRDPDVWAKAGGSPVTEADMAVDIFLRERLREARPSYGWLSEESAEDPDRRERDAVFVIDPIDGTRGFIDGDDRWCVSLAIVRNGRPVVAALNVPARGEFYTAAEGEGAWRGGTRLTVSERGGLSGARLTGPRGWLRTEAVRGAGAELRDHVPSLAYRIASVAADHLDAAFASPRAHDWDLAASDLLVHEAGGRVTGLDGAPPRYNRNIPRHGALAATNKQLQPELLAVVKEAEREVASGRKRR